MMQHSSRPINISAKTGKRNVLACLHYFVSRNDVEKVRGLLKGDRDKIPALDPNAFDEDGYTALHWAALKGHDKMVALLLEYKAAVDACDKDQWTPLHWAVQGNHIAVIQQLMQAKASTKIKEKWIGSKTAIDLTHDEKLLRIIRGDAAPSSTTTPASSSTPAATSSAKLSSVTEQKDNKQIFQSSRNEARASRGDAALAAAKKLERMIPEDEDEDIGRGYASFSKLNAQRPKIQDLQPIQQQQHPTLVQPQVAPSQQQQQQQQQQLPAVRMQSQRRYDSAGGVGF